MYWLPPAPPTRCYPIAETRKEPTKERTRSGVGTACVTRRRHGAEPARCHGDGRSDVDAATTDVKLELHPCLLLSVFNKLPRGAAINNNNNRWTEGGGDGWDELSFHVSRAIFFGGGGGANKRTVWEVFCWIETWFWSEIEEKRA